MLIDLSGKTALVTASTSGIGLAIATGLAESGARTVVSGRSSASVDRGLAEARARAPAANLQGVVADVGSAAGTARLISELPAVDILVNNAGIYEPRPFFDIDDAQWEHTFQVNVMSGVRLSRHYLRSMLARDWGRIVFISSESAVNIPSDMLDYGMSKTAQLSIARGLAKLVAGTGVTVNSVLPGPTLTEGVRSMLTEPARRAGKSLEQAGSDFVRTQRPSSLLRRMTTPEEVANLVVYVCSPQAAGTTGAALRVDGGVVDSLV
jgi:NAD(P)-dependent dehydrogenase (short-subunit alcohol dehydrogenase family)